MSAPDAPNLAAHLAARAARHPDRVAIAEAQGGRARRITFGALAADVAAVGAGLGARGIGPGDRVLMFVPPSIDLYTLLLGTLHAGATAVFVDAWADRARLDAAVAMARPKAFAGVPKAHLLRLTSAAVRAIPVALFADRAGLARLARRADVTAAANVAPGQPALITFTTGSTGRPKAAARSHAFLWAQHEVLSAHLAHREGDVDMPTLPVFVLDNLASGVTSVLPDVDPRRPADIDPDRVLAQMRDTGVTTTSGSPAFYERLVGACAARHEPLDVRALFTGGAPVWPALARLLAEHVRGESHVVYGSTEAEPIATIEAGAMLEAMAAPGAREGLCAGVPVEEIALRIIRAHDGPIALDAAGWSAWDVPQGEIGEIVVTGPHVLRGYLGDPEADRANKIRDGERVWHRTGDGGALDAGGRLWLAGRVGQRVQHEGVTWWSVPAELRAMRVPGVTMASYFGMPDASLGERAVLCVETAGGVLSDGDVAHLREALSPIPVDTLKTLAHLPRDPRHQSKVDVAELTRRGASARHDTTHV